MTDIEVGHKVNKTSGDYKFSGEVICVFSKKNGSIRYLVEDDRGLVLIMNEKQLDG